MDNLIVIYFLITFSFHNWKRDTGKNIFKFSFVSNILITLITFMVGDPIFIRDKINLYLQINWLV